MMNRITLKREGGFAIDVSLPTLDQGVTVLFGPSGCGKTTVLRCLAGLEKAQGYLEVAGQVWLETDSGIQKAAHQRSLGYVFQSAQLFPHKTVLENIVLGWQEKNERSMQGLTHALQILGISHLAKRYPHRLSGGEAQRVSIARAILRSPSLLLMDEPLSALDAVRKKEILRWLASIRKTWKMPMVYVTHSIEEVIHLADYVIQMDNGLVKRHGKIRRILPHLVQEAQFWNFCQGRVVENRLRISNGADVILTRPMLNQRRLRVVLDGRYVRVTRDKRESLSHSGIWPMCISSVKRREGSLSLTLQLRASTETKTYRCRIPKRERTCMLQKGRNVWVEWFGVQMYV